MANIIPSGKTPVQSADFTVAPGTPVTVQIFGDYHDAQDDILFKNSDGTYSARGQMNVAQPITTLSGPGTYAIRRQPCSGAHGVDNSL